MDARHLDRWALRHHGVVTKAATGLSDSAWKRALRAGRLVAIHPGVARLPGAATTTEQRISAAILAAGHGAMASHRSAAHLWGMPRPADDPVDLVVTDRAAPRTLAGVCVHRPIDLAQLIPQRRSGLPCTNILRTLVDLGSVDARAVEGAVGHALSTRLATLDALEATLRVHARRGRSGTVALRRAIDVWSIDAKPADSVLEAAMRRLAARHRLPPLEFHPVIAGWEVDFRIVGSPVIVECDGWASHGLRVEQFERDRTRDAELATLGWVVLRFTYRAITC